MTDNIAQTRIPRSLDSELVGVLDRPIQSQTWTDAGVDVRKRVYAVRVPREGGSFTTRLVSIDRHTVGANRKWRVVARIGDLRHPHRHTHHMPMQRMKGLHRVGVDVGGPGAEIGAVGDRWAEARATALAARQRREAAAAAATEAAAASRRAAAVEMVAAGGDVSRAATRWGAAAAAAIAVGWHVPPLDLQLTHANNGVTPPQQQPLAPSPATTAPLPEGGFDVSTNTPSCAICLDEEKLACCVWSGCGHRCACLDCARKCTALGSSSRCPICRVAGVPIAVRDVQRARA